MALSKNYTSCYSTERRMGGKSTMMMEPLRKSQNVFVGLFQTGAKMLGLGTGDAGKLKAGVSAGVTAIFLSGSNDRGDRSSNRVR